MRRRTFPSRRVPHVFAMSGNIEMGAVPAVRERHVEPQPTIVRTIRWGRLADGTTSATPSNHRRWLRLGCRGVAGDHRETGGKRLDCRRLDIEAGAVIGDALLGNQHLVTVVQRWRPVRRSVESLFAGRVIGEQCRQRRHRVGADVAEEHVHVRGTRVSRIHDGVIGQRMTVRALDDELPDCSLWSSDWSIGLAHHRRRIDRHR